MESMGYKVFTFKLREPLNGLTHVACLGKSEEDARIRAMEKGWDIVSSKDEKEFLQAMEAIIRGRP